MDVVYGGLDGDSGAERLVPMAPSDRRQLGVDEGRYTVPPDFNDPIEEDGRDPTGL